MGDSSGTDVPEGYELKVFALRRGQTIAVVSAPSSAVRETTDWRGPDCPSSVPFLGANRAEVFRELLRLGILQINLRLFRVGCE